MIKSAMISNIYFKLTFTSLVTVTENKCSYDTVAMKKLMNFFYNTMHYCSNLQNTFTIFFRSTMKHLLIFLMVNWFATVTNAQCTSHACGISGSDKGHQITEDTLLHLASKISDMVIQKQKPLMEELEGKITVGEWYSVYNNITLLCRF